MARYTYLPRHGFDQAASMATAEDKRPRLYELLSKVGDSDVTSDLAMAEDHLRREEHAQTERLVEAVLQLMPTSLAPGS